MKAAEALKNFIEFTYRKDISELEQVFEHGTNEDKERICDSIRNCVKCSMCNENEAN